MHPAFRFVARHALFIFPGMGFFLVAWALIRAEALLLAWIAFGGAMAVVWGLPIWLRRKPTAVHSPDEVIQQLQAGRISLLHFYSDF